MWGFAEVSRKSCFRSSQCTQATLGHPAQRGQPITLEAGRVKEELELGMTQAYQQLSS